MCETRERHWCFNAVVPKAMQRCRFQSKCDGADQIVYAAVPISKKCGGADQMCECQPLVFELPLGFGHQAGLQDGGACFEGAWWSRSIGHRGGADQFVNVAWATAAVPISMECAGADQMRERPPLVFELPLGFGHQAGLQDGGACFEAARWSRSTGHRGGADQFVNVAWATAVVPISMECAGADQMCERPPLVFELRLGFGADPLDTAAGPINL